MEATLSKLNRTPQDLSAAMIGRKSKSITPPFLITFEILKMNVHNFLVDSGASSTVMPYVVAKRLHAIPEKTGTRIMQLDRTNVKVIGELKDVLIRMAAKPQYTQVIDIVVVDIPKAYGMPLSRDWSAKLNGYFLTDWSHLLLPQKGKGDMLRVDRERYMKYVVFEDDEQILGFLHCEKTLKNAVIDEEEHDMLMNEREGEEKDQFNTIPKSIVKMEDLYDLYDKFKKPTNCKTHSSSMKYESVNLGTKEDPKTINLGLGCSPQEKVAFVKLFKEYKDIFAWTYGDLKTFDTSVMQHMIPLEKEAKPYQQKLCKMHPSLEPLVKKELNKMLDAKIIFPIRHTRWVANLVLVRKKKGDIRLCIYFRNLNKASQKDNYLVPSMEHILQCIFGSEMLSLLDGFSGYNQVLVSHGDWLKTTFNTKWGTYTYCKMPFGLINAGATFQRAMDIDF
eukprot:PITA_34992